MDGTVQTLTVKDSNRASLSDLRSEADDSHEDIGDFIARSGRRPSTSVGNWNERDGLVELRFDSNNYVTSIRTIAEEDIYSYFGDKNLLAGNNGFGGATSLTAAANVNDYSAGTYLAADSIATSDAKAYRVNGINGYMVGNGLTWTEGVNPGTVNHYDSSPDTLKLVGRTLYVTSDQHDEGLALARDAKAVLIQWENGDWKTTEYSTVSGAVSNVALNPTTGKFEGEVVAALNSNGTAAWVVITSYNELRRGGQVETPQTVYNVACAYVDPDNNYANFSGNEYVGFKLFGTTAGRTYEVVLTTSYGGITSSRTLRVNGTANTTVCVLPTNAFYGRLVEGTAIEVRCEAGVGYASVGADGSLYTTDIAAGLT